MNRGGFALPVTLLIVALISLMLAAGFTQVRADRELGAGAEASVRAFAVAQSGLQRYLDYRPLDGCARPIRPLDGDSLRINVPYGYADVVPRVLQRPADTLSPWLYSVTATGYYLTPGGGATPQARRTITQMAEWAYGTLQPQAAFTAANGLTQVGSGSGELRGNDHHAYSSCRAADINAVRVPGSGNPGSLSDYNRSGALPYVYANDAPSDVAIASRIDWAAVVGGAFVPEYTMLRTWDFTFPSMLVSGDTTLGSGGVTYGTGLLVVTGDLTIAGSYVQWYGVILVGGEILFTASDQRFDGHLASGLNAALGMPVNQGEIGGNNLDIDFDTRYIMLAMHKVAGFTPVSNTWSDNWAAY